MKESSSKAKTKMCDSRIKSIQKMGRHEKAKTQLIITGVKLKSKICKSVHDLANQFEQITSECCIGKQTITCVVCKTSIRKTNQYK